jgi:hypothetical protein
VAVVWLVVEPFAQRLLGVVEAPEIAERAPSTSPSLRSSQLLRVCAGAD